jgi:hypothetical protein
MNTITPETTPEETLAKNEEIVEKKRTVLNILAILGFLAVLILVAWLSIQVVKVLPNAFTSLANLAETLNGRGSDRTIVIESDKSEVVSGEEVTLSWDTPDFPGTFTFSYQCLDGVAVEVRKDNTTREVRCGTVYSLGETTEVRLYVTSEKTDEVSLPYTITFLHTNDTTPRASADGALAIVRDDNDTGTPDDEEVVVETPTPSTPTTPTTPSKPTTPAPPKPSPTTQYYTYSYLPTSDPKGTIDLRVTFIEMGVVDNGNLLARTSFTGRAENFFRFEVKNIGTKTSDEWSYTLNTPSDSDFDRDDEKPLKPNERAIITVRFPVDSRSGTEQVRVAVETDGDRVGNNDTLTWTAAVR